MKQGMRTAAIAGVLAAVITTALLTAGSAAAFTAAPGYAATVFASGFPNQGPGGVGPVGLAFDTSNQLYVMDYANGTLYRFGPSGGVAGDPGTVVGTPGYGFNNAAGLAFSPSGRLYVAVQGWGRVDELSPTDGHIVRTVSGGICSATGIAADPATGDLFAGFGCGGIVRISGYEPGPASVASLGIGGVDGITVGPDGSLYLAQFGSAVLRLVRTGPTTFGALQTLAFVPTSDGTAVAASLDPANPYVFANANNGTVTKIDTTGGLPGVTSTIFSGGSRGDFSTVGPDGCLYITQTDSIVRITNADGTCSFVPTTALPTITLAPATQADRVGDTATVTATLTNVAHPAGTNVTFTVTGPNGPYSQVVTADASGTVSFSYAGTTTGDDTVVATSHIGTLDVTSNRATVHWDPPLDTTAPLIVPTITGTLGDNGWYTSSPTSISFAVSDPESGIASSTGCDPASTGDAASFSVTCSATNGVGLSASDTETIKVDSTDPTISFTGNAGAYDVDEVVSIGCSSSDNLSGVASDTCTTTNAPAWTFGLGSHTVSATATDRAGNVGGGSTTFTVGVSTAGVCALVRQWVSNAGIANSLCVKLQNAAAARARGQNGAADNILAAFRNEVSAQRGKALTAAHADTLTALSYDL